MCTRLRFLTWFAPCSIALVVFFASAPAMAADSLEGSWQHQRDSGGWKVVSGGSATLRLDKNGQATLTATAPNQNPLEVSGTWSEQGGRITINIPGEIETNHQPYQLQGDTLTLPTQLSADKPGTSTWIRMKPQGIDLIFAAFNRAVGEGKGGATAAEEAAKEARKQEGVEKVEVATGGGGLVLTVTPSVPVAKKPRLYIIFATKAAPLIAPVQRKAPVSPLAGDPRVLIWDLCNEPQAFNTSDPVNAKEHQWLSAVAAAARESGAQQPITIGTMIGENIATYAPLCDVLCAHPYCWTRPELAKLIASYKALGERFRKPILVNECIPGCLDDRRRGGLAQFYVEDLAAAGLGWMGWALREGKAISTRRDRYDANGLDGQGFHPFFTRAGELRGGLEFLTEKPALKPPWLDTP